MLRPSGLNTEPQFLEFEPRIRESCSNRSRKIRVLKYYKRVTPQGYRNANETAQGLGEGQGGARASREQGGSGR